jgi:hypothetical protein
MSQNEEKYFIKKCDLKIDAPKQKKNTSLANAI